MIYSIKSVDPWSECLDPSMGGGSLPPTPLPVDPLADPPAQNLGGQPSNREAQTPFRPGLAKTTYPKQVPQTKGPIISKRPRGFEAKIAYPTNLSSWTSPGFSIL